MKKLFFAVAAMAAVAVGCSSPAPVKNELRAPAYPLITIDPYTSAWSPTDNLYDSQVMHWTEKKFPFVGTLRVDGQLYRFMGLSVGLIIHGMEHDDKAAAYNADITYCN